MRTYKVRSHRLRWSNRISSSDFDTHVVFIHARWRAGRRSRSVTKVEVQVHIVVLGADTV